MRQAWIVPACFYAIGVSAALVLIALIALGFPTLGLRYGLTIVCVLLVVFIPATGAYARTQPPAEGHCHRDTPGGTHARRLHAIPWDVTQKGEDDGTQHAGEPLGSRQAVCQGE